MATNSGYFPAPGAQNPGRYTNSGFRVGPNYLKYGEQEQNGYVYSPSDDRYYLSAEKRKQRQDYEVAQGLRAPTPSKPGLGETILPIGATIGAIELAKGGGSALVDAARRAFGAGSTSGGAAGLSTPQIVAANPIGSTVTAPTVATSGATQGLLGANQAGTQTPGLIGGAEAPATQGLGVAPYLGAASAGLGAYGLYNAIEANDEKSGAMSGAALGGGLAAAAPLLGLATGPVGLTAIGLSALGGAAFGAGLTSMFGKPSTRDIARKNTKELLSQNKDDPKYQSYVQSMRAQYDQAPPDPEKPFAGKYKTWDEYKKAGLEAADLTGVYGNIKTFGKDWANLSFDQQKAVTQGLINADLYNSKKGEVEIKDPNKAKEIFQQVIGGNVPAPTQPQNPAANSGLLTKPLITPIPNTPPPVPARSNTLSPGIGKDGKPINYGLMGAR